MQFITAKKKFTYCPLFDIKISNQNYIIRKLLVGCFLLQYFIQNETTACCIHISIYSNGHAFHCITLNCCNHDNETIGTYTCCEKRVTASTTAFSYTTPQYKHSKICLRAPKQHKLHPQHRIAYS